MFDYTIQSLINQVSNNWRAIIIGESDPKVSHPNFIHIEGDDFTKLQKLRMALDYLSKNKSLSPSYIARLDSDDWIDPLFLMRMESQTESFDVYYDKFHICVDPVFQKISYRRNPWIANTAIHRYDHALRPCGPENEILFLQSHNEFWHIYYSEKKCFVASPNCPLYYRVLSPSSITGRLGSDNLRVDWDKYLDYLDSYGPWISFSSKFRFVQEAKALKSFFESGMPKRSYFYWCLNSLKYLKHVHLGW